VEKIQLQFTFWLGKSASGKDTQAEIIEGKLPNTIRRSTGDIFRSAKYGVGEFAKYHSILEPYINNVDSGGLIPDEPIVNIVNEVILEDIKAGKRTFLYTGFPRTVIQLNLIDEMFRNISNTDFEIKTDYIYYSVTDETARERAEKRYQFALDMGETPRDDDTPEAFEKKLQDFYKLTKPLIQRLSIEDRLTIINSEKTIPEIEIETSQMFSKERV